MVGACSGRQVAECEEDKDPGRRGPGGQGKARPLQELSQVVGTAHPSVGAPMGNEVALLTGLSEIAKHMVRVVMDELSADAASGGCAPARDATGDRGSPGGESRASWGAGGWLTPQDRLLVGTPASRSQGRGRFRVR